jgi:hypothetical protein
MNTVDKLYVEAVDALVVEALRKKSPAERVAMIVNAHETARHLARAGIRFYHSDWNEVQVSEELARRMLGDAR